MQKTLAIVKPDAVRQKNVGEFKTIGIRWIQNHWNRNGASDPGPGGHILCGA